MLKKTYHVTAFYVMGLPKGRVQNLFIGLWISICSNAVCTCEGLGVRR